MKKILLAVIFCLALAPLAWAQTQYSPNLLFALDPPLANAEELLKATAEVDQMRLLDVMTMTSEQMQKWLNEDLRGDAENGKVLLWMVNFIYFNEPKSEFECKWEGIRNQLDLVPHFSRGVHYAALYYPTDPAIAGVFRYLRSVEICVKRGSDI